MLRKMRSDLYFKPGKQNLSIYFFLLRDERIVEQTNFSNRTKNQNMLFLRVAKESSAIYQVQVKFFYSLRLKKLKTWK